MRVSAATGADFSWLIERTSCALSPGARAVKVTDAAGAIRGMVAYDLWTETACFAHMAVDTPIAWRSLLPAVFEYPFLEAGKQLLLATIPAHNEKSWSLARRLGFTVTHVVRDGWALGDDLLFLELRRIDCRFLPQEYRHG